MEKDKNFEELNLEELDCDKEKENGEERYFYQKQKSEYRDYHPFNQRDFL